MQLAKENDFDPRDLTEAQKDRLIELMLWAEENDVAKEDLAQYIMNAQSFRNFDQTFQRQLSSSTEETTDETTESEGANARLSAIAALLALAMINWEPILIYVMCWDTIYL